MRVSLQKGDGVGQTIALVCAVLLSLAADARGFVFGDAPFRKFIPARSGGNSDDSEFGFSLAYFENDTLFLIGSPGHDNNTGALYLCSVLGLNTFPSEVPCTKLKIEDKYDGVEFYGNCVSNTDHQRLGTAVTVSGKDIMVCAPNWRNTCTQPYGNKFSMFIGTCYSGSGVVGPFGNFTPVNYYNTNKPPHYYTNDGFCQAGFSVAFTEELGGLVMGAPGCHSWAGDVFWAKVDDAGSAKRHNQAYQQSQLVQGSTSSESLIITDRYMGYTVAEGTFGGRQMVVSSAPREGVFNKGNILSDAATYILERDESKLLKIWASLFISSKDAWKFAYCGFSLAVVDFDLDGLDDVAIGCPYYGEDRGAFVIFFQRKTGGTYVMKKEENNFSDIQVSGKPESPRARVGDTKERFGSAIAGIGDIDGDGFPEFAVGAPGAQSGRGRVYIFRGEPGGLSLEPCQVLDAADNQKNFGWALASGANLLAVAMVSPAEVAVYSPRRVLLPELRLRTDVRLPVVEVRAVPVQVCLRYSVRGATPDSSKRRFEARLELDVGKDVARLQFSDGTTGRARSFVIEAAANNEVCVAFDVGKKSKADGITSYKLRANATLQASELADAVVDPLQVMDETATLEPELRCDDSECVTEVMVTLHHDGAFYTYDPATRLYLIVNVAVSRDPAYFVVLNFDTHGTLSYSGVQGQAELQCEGGTQFSCTGDILQDTKMTLNISLLPSQVMQESITRHDPEFNIAASLASFSNFSAASRPNASLVVPVALDLSFGVAGVVVPDTVELGTKTDVTTTFTLKNSNKYAYGVSFVVAPRDEAADCVSDIRLDNSTCSEHIESDLKIRCDYESFSGGSEETVVVSATVNFKEGCGAPLEGTATFSQLPFGLSAPSEAFSPSVTLHDDQAWYKLWWVWLLIVLGVLLVMLNVVIVVVYCVKKKQPQKNEATAGDAEGTLGQDATAGAHGEEPTDAQDDEGVTKPLKPQMNVP